MAEKLKVLGVDTAIVFLKDGGSTILHKGTELPDGVADEEKKRLKGLGVFDAPKVEKDKPSADAAAGPDPRVAELEQQLAAALAGQATAEAEKDAAVKAAADAGKTPPA